MIIPASQRLQQQLQRRNMATIQPTRISDRIKKDHEELASYVNTIKNSSDYDTQVRYQNQFIWELARHSIAEEIVVYPAFEQHVLGGKEMADKDRKEHLEVKKMLYEFQKMTPKSPEFMATLDNLWSNLQQHIKEEETEDLPALEKALQGDDSNSMATSFHRTKHFVPTQSHPSAPDKPPFETAAGLLTTPIDKLMDMFKRFPKDV